jgi:DNA-binding helix-hairpin-helix protein with protein kinase domain
MNRPKLYDQQGRPVHLGLELGKGGEGSVFEVAEAPELVAKIYHQPIDARKAGKLAAMVRQQGPGLLEVAAWPVGTLSRAPRGSAVGLLMPRVSGFKPVHLLYGPKSRLAEFPQATWSFLVHTACNVARALAVVHAGGNVVGDINHGNLLVSSRAMIKLIDCDSFQIEADRRRFLCEVGVPTHTPPELQGFNLRTVPRTPNHDAFGLAVVLFQLLFLGRHPFSGTYQRPGDMPLEQAIREFRFAYGSQAETRQMRQPPRTPPLAITSPPVATLFERAFSPHGARDGGRPRPGEWIAALENLRLRACARRPVHTYAATLDSCPWCPIEIATGTALFKAPGPVRAAVEAFDVAAVWERILAVHAPGPTPEVELLMQANIPYLKQLTWMKIVKSSLFIGVIGIIPTFVASDHHGAGGEVLGILVTVLTIGLFARRYLRVAAAVEKAEGQLDELKRLWEHQPDGSSFQALIQHLDQITQSYFDLPAVQQRRLAELGEGLRKRQLERHLDLFHIDVSGLAGLEPGILATLQSYGIETAADATAANLLKVPGLDKDLIDRLYAWRQQLENAFQFDAARGIDSDDLIALHDAMDEARKDFERELLAGPEQLRKSTDSIARRRVLLKDQITAAVIIRNMAVEKLCRMIS